MTGEQLIALALNDPFSKYYTIAYVQTTTASTETLRLYNNITDGEEINNMSDYLGIAEFFSSTLEAAIGVNRIFLKLHSPQTSKSFTQVELKNVFGHLELQTLVSALLNPVLVPQLSVTQLTRGGPCIA